jgi:hypothetical protein
MKAGGEEEVEFCSISVEFSGQLHTLAAVPPRKDSTAPIQFFSQLLLAINFFLIGL